MKNFQTLINVDNLLSSSTQATVDLNNDLVPGLINIKLQTHNKEFNSNSLIYKIDLFLTTNHNNKPKFRVHELPITTMILITEYDPPANVAVFHLSTFADIG